MVLQCTSEDDHWDYHWNDIWIIHSIGKLYLDISNNTMEIRTTSNSHYFISNIRTAMDYWKLDFIFYVLYIYILYSDHHSIYLALPLTPGRWVPRWPLELRHFEGVPRAPASRHVFAGHHREYFKWTIVIARVLTTIFLHIFFRNHHEHLKNNNHDKNHQ